jgi:hypothetical protein
MNNMHVEAYAYSLNKKQEELCGDRVKMITNQRGFIMVLSDGLGSGVKANILATLTTTVLSELLIEGIDLQEALETMALVLPECKERKLAYSTFAILQVYYDGRAKLVEFDTPQSLLIHQGKHQPLRMETMIFGQRTIREIEFNVTIGDCIMLLSDGLLHASGGMVLDLQWDDNQIANYLETIIKFHHSPITIAHQMLNHINQRYGGLPGDDSTVAVACIVPATETIVMVGPPVDPLDDRKVVQRLMSASGKKIVCGGTTAEIVSRETGLDMMHDHTMDLSQGVPGCRITGIDLVCEGAITLNQTVSYLQEAKQSMNYLDFLLSSTPQDWSQRLVKQLLSDTTQITFLMGCSNNLANDPNSLSDINVVGKIHMVQNIGNILQTLGKSVTIEYY